MGVRDCLLCLNSTAGISHYTSVTESLHPRALLLLRFLSFLLAVFTVFVGVEITKHSYLLFLTHWGVVATAIYFTIVLAAYSYPESRPCVYFAFESALILELIITIGFWTTVYPFLDFELDLAYNLIVHGGLMVLLLCDFALNRIEFFTKHYSVTAVIIGMYAVVNAYVALTEQPVYPLITFRDVTSYMVIAVLFLFGLLSHRLLSSLHRLKSPLPMGELKFELGPILSS